MPSVPKILPPHDTITGGGGAGTRSHVTGYQSRPQKGNIYGWAENQTLAFSHRVDFCEIYSCLLCCFFFFPVILIFVLF